MQRLQQNSNSCPTLPGMYTLILCIRAQIESIQYLGMVNFVDFVLELLHRSQF